MNNREINDGSINNLSIKYFESSSLIGSDTLEEEHIDRIKKEIGANKKLDPVIIYEYKGAKFIIEGNQRAGAYGKLGMNVPCVEIKNEEDFQTLIKMDIKIGKLENFKSLKEIHSALADHMRDTREDKYLEYFDEKK